MAQGKPPHLVYAQELSAKTGFRVSWRVAERLYASGTVTCHTGRSQEGAQRREAAGGAGLRQAEPDAGQGSRTNNSATLASTPLKPMSVFQTALSSAKFNRALMWVSAVILFVGVAVLLTSLVRGSDKTSVNPDKGFHPKFQAASAPLQNKEGVTITKYDQLDPEVRSTIRTFLATAVKREHLDKSWAVIAPSMRKGYTFQSWSHAKELPVIPYPIADVDSSKYYLDYASTKEILLEVGVSAPDKAKLRPTSFQLGLSPVAVGANKKVWRVDYWMPRWTPPLPTN